MITLVKVNVLTDDESIPTAFRDQITALLRDLLRDDPEGGEHAKVSLEWKHTVHNREYMATLPATGRAERITAPRQPERKPTKKAGKR